MSARSKPAPAATAPPAPAPAFEAERELTGAELRGEFSHANLLRTLFDAAEATLSDSDLAWLASSGEQAETLARQAAMLTEGLGCLVAEDVEVGSFQSPDTLTSLLFHLSSQFSLIAGMVDLNCSARYALKQRGAAAS